MMKMSRLFVISTLAIVLSGCGGPNEYKPAEGMSAADIFADACQACHGENGGGKFGFLLKLAGTDTPIEEITTLLKDGGHIMPSFPNMSEEQHLAMAAYVKML